MVPPHSRRWGWSSLRSRNLVGIVGARVPTLAAGAGSVTLRIDCQEEESCQEDKVNSALQPRCSSRHHGEGRNNDRYCEQHHLGRIQSKY